MCHAKNRHEILLKRGSFNEVRALNCRAQNIADELILVDKTPVKQIKQLNA